jgi:hypothetical protein
MAHDTTRRRQINIAVFMLSPALTCIAVCVCLICATQVYRPSSVALQNRDWKLVLLHRRRF